MYYKEGKLLSTEEIPVKNFEIRAKRIETRNLRNFHESITFTGILQQLQPCVIEYVAQAGGCETVVINKDIYKKISKTAGIVNKK